MRRIVTSSMQIATVAALFAVGVAMFRGAEHRVSASPQDRSTPAGDIRGRRAEVPEEVPAKGLWDVAWRVLHEISDDRVMLIAAGVTFYLLLAIFPALAALVSLYGLIADPSTIAGHLRTLSDVLPPGAFDVFADQISSLVSKHNGELGLTFFVGLAIALWSTHSGTLALFDAMNVAYEEKEKRSYVRLNLVALCFTLCTMIAAAAVVALVAVMPVVLSYVWLDRYEEVVALLARWPALLLIVAAAILAIYRFGPSREPARFRWLTWGAVLTALTWFAMSFAFSFYLGHFANYNATYGTLGALIGFLIWTWLSVTILIVGAELNAELEHQTEKDTTTGTPSPMGARGAYVADTLGEVAD